MTYGPSSILGDVLRNKQAADVVHKYLPGLPDELTRVQFMHGTLEQVTSLVTGIRTDPAARAALYAELAAVEETANEPVAPIEVPVPSRDYEAADVPTGSAPLLKPTQALRWRPFELELHGPAHGNPFTDVVLSAEFRRGERTQVAHGFYDGEGVYRIRFMPDAEGSWTFRTSSNARSLDQIGGEFTCGPATAADHGPIRVHGTYHFRHADGTRYLPVGTTAYAWTHQGDKLEELTLRTLAGSPFNKIRMCVFPKSFVHNTNEPPRYPFERSDDGFDVLRPNPAYFRHLERRIAQLGALGIQADVILFHPYDRWGFSDLGSAADDLYVRYVVSRLAAYPNVWWSLANEYDLLWAKQTADWNRYATLIGEHDPHDHLISVHNWVELWDNEAPWATHTSFQGAPARTAELRDRWHKPVLIDECGYEGDIEWGWGNLPPQELVRRCWETVVQGGYVTHGECFLDDDDVLWWSKGGSLKGQSTARIRFLRSILDDLPPDAAGIDPLPSDFDVLVGGIEGRYQLIYFGNHQPRRRTISVHPGTAYRVDLIDTWNMTITELPDTHQGELAVELPGRPDIAIRLRAVQHG